MRKFNVLVGTIPVRDGSVLLLQRSFTEKFMPGAWGLPCGKIDFGEDLEVAALRELREESGLHGQICALVGTSSFMSQKGDDELHNLQINYLIEVSSGDVILDHSSAAFRWLPFEEVATSDLDDFTRSTIAQAKNNFRIAQ